jgi:1-deoxy-D-xylulose-5-phosphate reductoisomerase
VNWAFSLEIQKLAILGSTGSIGTQALDIVRQHPDRFEVIALSSRSRWEVLLEQIREFKPKYALLCDQNAYHNLKEAARGLETEVIFGEEKLADLVSLDEVHTVLNSLVGFVGFIPTLQAVKSGKKVALANKESLVVGGALIREHLQYPEQLIPVDSEHSAMLQCLVGEDSEHIEKIIITASGGPFRDYSPEQMKTITVEKALKHPNWDMGAKITIDSSTMMNKGLEIIEAFWLFGLELEQIEPVIHPQSIIHSIVTFVDGSSKAQLGPPDMKVPIIYALSYPGRFELDVPRMDWSQHQELTFKPVNYQQFPCVKLAMEAIEEGGFAPAVLNAANEIAVQRFLDKEISYIQIPELVDSSLNKIRSSDELSAENLKIINQEARDFASRY